MADVFSFIRQGWNSVWKQKTIWLFSAIVLLNQLFNVFPIDRNPSLALRGVLIILMLISITLSLISLIGVPYLAYRSLIGSPATIRETLSAVKKFSGRVIGCSCLGALVFFPVFFVFLVLTTDRSPLTSETSNNINWALWVLGIFAALWQFTLAAFFEHDWGIRKSLEKAWGLFKNHFVVLAVLGLILALVAQAFLTLSGVLTVLIQSGFDISSINNFNFLNPFVSLRKNLLFVLIVGIGQMIYLPLMAHMSIAG